MLLELAMLLMLHGTSIDDGYSSGETYEITAYNESGQWQKTKTGTIPVVGRTAAVDPHKIPLNSWIYIEGLGFRKAEDTGGAVKGNVVDVYLESIPVCYEWGRRERKVWVIWDANEL